MVFGVRSSITTETNVSEMPLDATERSLYARALAHQSWAQTEDRSKRTAPARAAAMARFENEVDPDRVLDAAERARRAENARKAYYTQLALKSHRARRARKAGGEK